MLLVDLSGSMGTRTMDLARHTAEGLLCHAHVRRDRLALLGFRGRRAALLVPPTANVDALRRPLRGLATGGTTPLGEGLRAADDLLGREARRRGTAGAGTAPFAGAAAGAAISRAAVADAVPGESAAAGAGAAIGNAAAQTALLIISDGRGNVGRRPGQAAISAEIAARARALARRPDLRRLLIDTTEPGKPDLAARELARHLRAQRLSLATLQRTGSRPLFHILSWLDAAT
jgi:Mg-chelatase subunit ChlD